MSDAKKSKLSTAAIFRLFNCLNQLDGREKIVTANGKESVVMVPYSLGIARLTIAKNSNSMRKATEAFSAARQKLLVEHTTNGKTLEYKKDKDGNTIPDPAIEANTKEFADALAKMMDDEQEVDIWPITASSLKLDENAIPPVVLAGLTEVIDMES